MKHSKKSLVLAATVLLTSGVLASCGGKDENRAKVEAAVADAETLTRDELMEKAANELGTNNFKFLATTSRGGKDEVKKGFVAELNKYNPAIKVDQIKYDSTVDGQVYTTLAGEIDSGTHGYNAAIVQDGYQLQKKGIDRKRFINYIPKEWKDDVDTNKEVDGNPMSLQYNFKTWMVNNKNGDTVIDNVWDVTARKYKGKIDTMDPTNENVNMDWLIMLTGDSWCDNLKAAFDDPSNDAKSEIDLSAYAKYGEKKQYAYAFIDRFIDNAVFYEDDGKAVNNLVKTPGNIGWIVYSKLITITETEGVSKKNIVIAPLGSENTDGAALTGSQMKGFGGFMYKHYLQVMPTADYPYTACAFLNFISTTKLGYSKWASDVGDYPTMPSINENRTKYGHGELVDAVDGKGNKFQKFVQSDTAENVFPCLNDPSGAWWNDPSKGNAVIETPSFIGANYAGVREFIDVALANK